MAMTIIEMARKGGFARAKKLTAKRRSEIARHAANVRWGNLKRKKDGKSKKS